MNDLPNELRQNIGKPYKNQSILQLSEVEKQHITKTFKETGNQIRETARLLSISRNTLKKKLID